ncbi:MAG: tetratricopeptide repeat protein [Parvibaculales bacterium]
MQLALTQPVHAQTLLRGPGAAALDPMFQDVLKKPNNVELNLAFARRAIELEDFEAAVATLERLLIGRSGLPLIRLELGMLYLRLEAPELAEAYFLQVLEVPNLEAEPRQRAEILLAETRRASRKGSFALSSSFGIKHSTNASTQATADDFERQNSENSSINPLLNANQSSDIDSDASTSVSLGISYSRELQGLTERRFSMSLNRFASFQQDDNPDLEANLDKLDVGVTSFRAGLVMPLVRAQGRLPLSIDPYLAVSNVDTDSERNYSLTGSVGVVINGFASSRTPLSLSLEVGNKSHNDDANEAQDSDIYSLGVTMGRNHTYGGYSSFGLKFDRTEAQGNPTIAAEVASGGSNESLTGGTFSFSHNYQLRGWRLGAGLSWRESRRDGYYPLPLNEYVARNRYDKDGSANLSLGTTLFGFSVDLSASYFKRDSNIAGVNYDDTTGSLTFSRSFQ